MRSNFLDNFIKSAFCFEKLYQRCARYLYISETIRKHPTVQRDEFIVVLPPPLRRDQISLILLFHERK